MRFLGAEYCESVLTIRADVQIVVDAVMQSFLATIRTFINWNYAIIHARIAALRPDEPFFMRISVNSGDCGLGARRLPARSPGW
jgi:hypothetical protein